MTYCGLFAKEYAEIEHIKNVELALLWMVIDVLDWSAT